MTPLTPFQHWLARRIGYPSNPREPLAAVRRAICTRFGVTPTTLHQSRFQGNPPDWRWLSPRRGVRPAPRARNLDRENTGALPV
jgi:hypothetical protein